MRPPLPRVTTAALLAITLCTLSLVSLSRLPISSNPTRAPFFAAPPGPAANAAAAAASLPWVPVAALADANFSTRSPAHGCPAAPALCRLEHVFDEIVVIGLPRFGARALRATAQLDALGAPYTLVHAHDVRNVGAAAAAVGLGAGEYALWLTHLSVFAYVARSPFRHVLLVEDDATLAADFPAAFDALARALPRDWRFLALGQSLICHDREAPCTAKLPAPLARPAAVRGRLYASFSVAFERAAAAEVERRLAASKDVIDRAPYAAVWARWANESYFAWPPVVAMDPYSGSTIGNSWPVPVKTWKIQNGVDAARFDLRGGGYRAGAGRVPAVPARFCDAPGAVLPGVNIPGGDIAFAQFDKEPPKPLPAADPRACCAHCVDSFPVCAAWTHVAGKGCFIKKAAPGRANAALDFSSGELAWSS